MDATDRRIINTLQGGFPLCERPFAAVAAQIGTGEEQIIERIQALLDSGHLSRFGPLFRAEGLGGAVTLAAIEVPEERFEEVAQQVNAHPEVAHNYARAHRLNMWFVIATETPERLQEVVDAIETETGLWVHELPKRREFYIGLQLEV